MRIAVDAMGGDFAPDHVVRGAALALEELDKSISLTLVGDKEAIEGTCNKNNIPVQSFEIHHAPEAIGMDEHPTKAIAQKHNSSIVKGFALLKNKEIKAFCGAGNNSAMLVGALFSVRPIEGIIRPAIAGFVPNESGKYSLLLDVGANTDVRQDVLFQFGELGAIYAKSMMGIDNPRIAIMNIGADDGKGTLLVQAAYQLFRNHPKVNFIGNIEGNDLFSDKADVIVCDRFTGGIILKMAESFYDLLNKRNFLDGFLSRLNYETIGGHPVLGVNGNVVIGNGISSPQAIKNMILLAYRMAEANFYQKIKQVFGE